MKKPSRPRRPTPPLLDPWEREGAITGMRGWLEDYPKYNTAFSDTIKRLIIAPLNEWIIAMGDDAASCQEVQAAYAFLIFADYDLAHRFQEKLSVFPEHINQLDELWREYQFVTATAIAIGQEMRAAVVSKTNSKSAKGPRKPVTREQLLAHRDDFIRHHGGSARSWPKTAAIDFNLSTRWIREKMRN